MFYLILIYHHFCKNLAYFHLLEHLLYPDSIKKITKSDYIVFQFLKKPKINWKIGNVKIEKTRIYNELVGNPLGRTIFAAENFYTDTDFDGFDIKFFKKIFIYDNITEKIEIIFHSKMECINNFLFFSLNFGNSILIKSNIAILISNRYTIKIVSIFNTILKKTFGIYKVEFKSNDFYQYFKLSIVSNPESIIDNIEIKDFPIEIEDWIFNYNGDGKKTLNDLKNEFIEQLKIYF